MPTSAISRASEVRRRGRMHSFWKAHVQVHYLHRIPAPPASTLLYSWCTADALRSPGPSMPVSRNYLARPKCSHRARLILDVPEQCCGVCLPNPTSTGSASCSLASMIPQRHRSGHCTRPRLTSISGPLCGAKEFPVATIRARAILRPALGREIGKSLAEIAGIARIRGGCPALGLAIGISLAEIAGIARSAAAVPRWASRLAYRLRKLRELQDPRRPSRAEPRDWHIACENCENPRLGLLAGYRGRFGCTPWVRQQNPGQMVAHWSCLCGCGPSR